MRKYLVDIRVPKYVEIKNVLLSKIKDRTYPQDSMLPSERELIQEHSVSSITVRRAFQELVVEGYVVREPGRGSFVKSTEENVSQNIGLVLCEADPSTLGYHNLIRELERELYPNRRHLTLLTIGRNNASERRKIEDIVRQNEIGSFFLLGKVSPGDYKFAKSFGLPILVLGNTGLPIHIPQVKYDAYLAGKMAASRLLSYGYKQIGFLNGSHHYAIARDLFKGFQDAYKENGLSYREDIVYWTKERRAYLEAQELLEKMDLSIPAAILLEGGTITDTFRVIEEKAIKLPGNLSLMGIIMKDYYVGEKILLSAVKFSLQDLVKKICLASEKLERGEKLKREDKTVGPIFQQGNTLTKINGGGR